MTPPVAVTPLHEPLFENDLHRRIARIRTMRALLTAIALCAGLQAAAAPQPAAHTVATRATAGQGELHAQLVASPDGAPASQRRADSVVVASSLQPMASPAPASGAPGERRPATAAMLLAALALMTGIALRRWGAGQQ
jgi:hypothetical protein